MVDDLKEVANEREEQRREAAEEFRRLVTAVAVQAEALRKMGLAVDFTVRPSANGKFEAPHVRVFRTDTTEY